VYGCTALKHVTYKLAYHFVWCPKYRKKILVAKLATFVEQEIRHICETNTWTIGALNVQADHVGCVTDFCKSLKSKRDILPGCFLVTLMCSPFAKKLWRTHCPIAV